MESLRPPPRRPAPAAAAAVAVVVVVVVGPGRGRLSARRKAGREGPPFCRAAGYPQRRRGRRGRLRPAPELSNVAPLPLTFRAAPRPARPPALAALGAPSPRPGPGELGGAACFPRHLSQESGTRGSLTVL